MQDRNAPPLNPLPPVVWLLILPLIAIEVVVALGGTGMVGGPAAIGWRSQAVQVLAFSPDMMRAMIAAHQYPLEGMWRLVSYPLVHGSVSHALFVVVILTAMGKFVSEVFHWAALLAVVVVATVVGALTFTALPMIHQPLIGGWVPIYGLIGAFSWILWMRLRDAGPRRWRAFSMIGALLSFQVIFGVLFGSGWDWAAELPAFVAGFALSFVVSPGGFARVWALLRQR